MLPCNRSNDKIKDTKRQSNVHSILIALTSIFSRIGKKGMKDQEYCKELEATAAYTVRAGEGTTQVKEAKTALIGDAWFRSVKAAAAAVERNMEVVH